MFGIPQHVRVKMSKAVKR